MGEAALTISGSPLGSLFGFLKGNRGLEEAKGLLDYIFFSIPTAMTLLQNCITSLLDSHNLLPVSMSFTPGHLPSHSQTILPKHQSQIPTQGPTMATQEQSNKEFAQFGRGLKRTKYTTTLVAGCLYRIQTLFIEKKKKKIQRKITE